jgi:hypothetical protein
MMSSFPQNQIASEGTTFSRKLSQVASRQIAREQSSLIHKSQSPHSEHGRQKDTFRIATVQNVKQEVKLHSNWIHQPTITPQP